MNQQKTRHDELREAAELFHKQNPEVWQMFCNFTLSRIRDGFKHYGAKGVMERVRWEVGTRHGGEHEWKINNNLTSFYARRFMVMHPEHAGFFRTREQISKRADPANRPELVPGDFPTYPNAVHRVAP